MENLSLSGEDLEELRRLAEYLSVHHADIINADPDYKLPPNEKTSAKLKFGAVMGYKGKTIYEIINNQAISERSLKLFSNRFDRLRKKALHDPIAKSYIIRAANLIAKLEKQKTGSRKKGDARQVYEKNEIITRFEDSQWYLYERSAYGIERHIILFKKSDIKGQLTVEIKSNRENTSSWLGKAVCTSTNEFLVIDTFYNAQLKTLPINFFIRVSNRYTRIDLCVGHMMSTSDTFHHIVTRIVVLENHSGQDALTATRFSINEDGVENAVGTGIYKLLHDIDTTRLSSPHSAIVNETMLNQWHTEIERDKRKFRNKNIIGEYNLFYKGEFDPDQPLTMDKLIIKENFSADLIAEYFHEVDKGFPQRWLGNVSYSSETRAAFVSLRGPVIDNVVTNTSEIFLILNIPPGGRIFDTVTGVVTGVTDSDEGVVSLFVVAVKDHPGVENVEIQKEKLVKFFKSTVHARRIGSPKVPVATLEELLNNIPPSDT